MATNKIIRKATIQDCNAIYNLYQNRFDSNDADDIKYKLEDFEWFIKNKSNSIILVAKDIEFNLDFSWREKIVGFIFGYDMGLWGYIEHIVIKDSHRRKGFGKALVESFSKQNENWELIEACYYSEIEALGKFFESSNMSDGGINTRWVYKQLKQTKCQQ